MNNKEEHIIQLLSTKDKRAISMIYDRYGAALYGIVLKIVRSEEIAEDVMQDAFVKVWQNGDKYETSKGSLFTWLLNIARRTAIDATRSSAFKQRTKIQSIDTFVSNNDQLSTQLNTDQIGLKNLVNHLDLKHKEVIDLLYFQGFTQKEASEHLDIPLGSVKTRVRIAIRELRTLFQDKKMLTFIITSLLLFGL